MNVCKYIRIFVCMCVFECVCECVVCMSVRVNVCMWL